MPNSAEPMNPPAADRPLGQATDALVAAAVRHMEDGFEWFRDLGTAERTSVTQVVRAGIEGFTKWLAHPSAAQDAGSVVFGAAPPEMARAITLEQTVALVRTTVAVVESAVDELVDPVDRRPLREAILRYSREIAFSAAEVYARAAEAQGAWIARIEAMVVDALLRDDLDADVLGRLSALGWRPDDPVIVAAANAPAAAEPLRHAVSSHGLGILTGVQGTTLIAMIGGSADDARIGRLVATAVLGPVVISRAVVTMPEIGAAARSVRAGLAAVNGWPDAPRPVRAEELLPERVLNGDPSAAAELIATVFAPLAADRALHETASTYLESTGSLEGTARALFIHPNTVRHRLRRIEEATGRSPADPRDAFVLRMALALGRLAETAGEPAG